MTLRVCETVGEFREACDAVRARGARLGLVPTMGALHTGHAALIRAARRHTDAVAVTIFVNPTQFGPNEDLARYPRTLQADLQCCSDAGAELVFTPGVDEMYPKNERTRVTVSGLTAHLCGASRPGHFDGVSTIVTKLFAVAGPCTAVFGRKDYQQLKVIERMTRDLLLPVRIVPHATVREADGLALSSRNRYLSPEERERALSIPRALSDAAARFSAGERRPAALVSLVSERLQQAALRVDYVTLADPEELTPFAEISDVGNRALLAIAASCGTTRLIDNIVLGEDTPPIAAGVAA
ncbi:MAG TPA: pantoate--beta-alanine ligase [Polyangiaceae bacterium]|nr:pantoate--beta-alanine ligase [Polyangiaceae bacterium]